MPIGTLVGTESLNVNTAAASVVSGQAQTTGAVALLAASLPAKTNTNINTAGNGTLTAAGLVTGTITRSGPPGNFTDTTDTAAAIIAALPAGTPVNYSQLVFIRNTTAFVQTITGGTNVTVSGNLIVPANATGIFQMIVTSSAAVSLQGIGVGSQTDIGVIMVNTAITTVGAGTLTAAAMVGGVITRSGPTAAFVDTTDTAANIIAALPNAALGQSWELTYVNTTAFAATIAGGTGVTPSGLAGPVPANSTATFLVTYSGAGAVTLVMIAVAYNAAGGYDPATVTTQFGGSTSAFFEEGPFYREVDVPPINPGSIGNNNVMSTFTIPANALNAANKGFHITAKGNFGANTNNKRVVIVVGATTAVVGSAVVGGTILCDSGTVATNAGGWQAEAEVFKYGALGSNTQLGTSHGVMTGSTHGGTGGVPTTLTLTEASPILCAVCGNATTLVGDISLYQVMVDAKN